jgi:hypothetical protein
MMVFSPRWRSRHLLVAAVVLFHASTAFADASAADRETARRFMAEGRDRRNHNDHKGALVSFMAADAIMHVPTTGLEVAREHVAVGNLVEARDTALRVTRIPPQRGEPRPFTRARAEARAMSDDLAKKIPTITVQVRGADKDASISIDGASIPPAAMGTRSVNPGHHTIVVSAGDKEANAEVDVGEAEQKQVQVEVKERESKVREREREAEREAEKEKEREKEKEKDKEQEQEKEQETAKTEREDSPKSKSGASGVGKPLMIGGFALGAAGLVVGSVTGLISLSKTSSIKDNCFGTRCPTSEKSNIDSAKNMATVANISFGIAIVGAGVGVLGYFLWKGEQARESEAPPAQGWLTVRPYVSAGPGGGSGGVAGAF